MRAEKGILTAGRGYNNVNHISRRRNEGIATFWAKKIKLKKSMKSRHFATNLLLKSHKIK